MRDVAAAILLLAGALFCLLGAVGLIRMPDLFTRLQAATKTGTLGVGFILVATAVHYGDLGVAVRAVLVIVFLFMTAPVAAHVIARAAYFVKVPLWEHTQMDQLRDMYEKSGWHREK